MGGEWQIVATVQLEALKTIAVFEASVQPHDTLPSCAYLLSMLERNRTKRNSKCRFLIIMRAVAILFVLLFSETERYCTVQTFFDCTCTYYMYNVYTCVSVEPCVISVKVGCCEIGYAVHILEA